MTDADKLQLGRDGTVLAVVKGKTYRMVRPTIGQYRKLRELAHGMDDEVVEVAGKQDTLNKERAAAVAASDTDTLSTVRGALRKVVVDVEDLRLDWISESWKMLGDKPLPPSDEWPALFLDPKLPGNLLDHWRDRPLAPGSDGS